MTAPLWPVELPHDFLRDLQEIPGDGSLRFQPDAGPALTRRRFTAVATRFVGQMVLESRAQKNAMDTFYHSTTAEGSLSFHFPDPNVGFASGSATSTSDPEWRFLRPPRYTHLSGDGTATKNYRVDLNLERLP